MKLSFSYDGQQVEVDTDDLTLADRHAVRIALGEMAFVDGAGRVVEPDELDRMALEVWRLASLQIPDLQPVQVLAGVKLADLRG